MYNNTLYYIKIANVYIKIKFSTEGINKSLDALFREEGGEKQGDR